jgi:dihydroorotate dehydrogenase
MLYKTVKKVLFRFDPEQAHYMTFSGLDMARRIPGGLAVLRGLYDVPVTRERSQELFGLTFPNPVGLAAGLDKNGTAVPAFSSIGFGFLEVGTVTPKAQPGNEQPRLFRLVEDEALINRMGFNNEGTEAMARHLDKASQYRSIPIAINIGKNKVTPNEDAADDYRRCVKDLYKYADFFVVNISSPNTPDLRNLQHGDYLKHLLQAVKEEGQAQAKRTGSKEKAILVKIAPDLTTEELEQMVDTTVASGISGIIATNTTLSREGLTHPKRNEAGGLSGKPLTERSTEVIRHIYRQTQGQLPIIGSGGIFTAEHAYEKIRAGASLVEIYTSLIYRGPGVLREINEQLTALLKRDGYGHISEAIGADT